MYRTDTLTRRKRERYYMGALILLLVAAAAYFLVPKLLAPAASVSGKPTGWHTVSQPTYKYKVDMPCQDNLFDNLKGPTYSFSDGCLYQGGSFSVSGGPSSGAGDYAALRQLVSTPEEGQLSLKEVRLAGRPALIEQRNGTDTTDSKEQTFALTNYWLQNNGYLYLVGYQRPEGSEDLGDRFFKSFQFTR